MDKKLGEESVSQSVSELEHYQSQLVEMLRRSVGLLDDSQATLKAEVVEACDRINHPTYRVAVFGPFNYGKSTLLNALLGEKALPMDLVPTTGAAITVKYGPEPRTRITHTDGSINEEVGTGALKEFAVLDEQRRMREDVAAVEVYCPHPLLKLGLELIDLPGTDDRDAQDELIKKQLLSADLVIQLLDGRKLMTLAERENLRDWLLDRGINTVIFVVNFLNLMEGNDRQQVAVRLRFLAESFRSNLPAGVSNLYQVDALPALRARLKGDMAAATQTGLPALESALQNIGQQLGQGRGPEQTLPRLKAIAKTVPPALQAQIDTLSISQPDPTDTRRVEVKKKAQTLIQKGFDQSLTKLRTWLEPDNLQANYRLGLAQALENNTTQDWLLQNLRPAWFERQKPLVSWVHQACEFFEKPRPVDVWMAFSHAQEEVNTTTKDAETGIPETDKSGRKPGMAPVAIATGLGWMLGGPLGAAVLAGASHLVNQAGVNQAGVNQPGTKQRSAQEQSSAASDRLEKNNAVVDFKEQADIYLSRFSAEALSVIAAYDIEAKKVIQTKVAAPVAVNSAAREAQLNLLKTTLVALTDIVERLPIFS
ncbi:MAG: dynamin family protein [Cyanobacteria bacterium P01_F01_bin.53]